MNALPLYLLKANVVLVLFAAAYYGLLRQLTFFGLNRFFLLLAVAVAVGYPVLPTPTLLAGVPASVVLPTASNEVPILPAVRLGQPMVQFSWVLVLGYALGSGFLLLRLLGQLLSLGRLRGRSRQLVVLGQAVRLVPGTGNAFSFGKDIYLTASVVADTTSLPAILRHEQAHVGQAHTLDVLLLHLLAAAAWPNPAAWLLRRAALDNLEYLADQAALQTGLDRYAYQHCLVGQRVGTMPVPALAFRYAAPTLKKRILMLGQPRSSSRQLARYLLVSPLVISCLAGLSLLVACEQPLGVAPTAPTATALLTASTLKQPNGRPINVHRINKLNLRIAFANHYALALNALSEEQRQARRSELDALIARHDYSFATRERIAKLSGFASLAAQQLLLDKLWNEGVLANQEDPEFYRDLTEQEQLAVEAVIYAHNQRTGGPTFISISHSPIISTNRE